MTLVSNHRISSAARGSSGAATIRRACTSGVPATTNQSDRYSEMVVWNSSSRRSLGWRRTVSTTPLSVAAARASTNGPVRVHVGRTTSRLAVGTAARTAMHSPTGSSQSARTTTIATGASAAAFSASSASASAGVVAAASS